MFRKSLISLAVSAAIAMSSGCDKISSVEGNEEVDKTPLQGTEDRVADGTHPVFRIVSGAADVPLATDLVFANSTDGTISVNDNTNPVTAALGDQAGFSTTAPIDIPVSAALLPASVVPGAVWLVEFNDNDATDALDLSQIVANFEVPFAIPGLIPGQDYQVSYLNLSGQPTIRILPNHPLNPKTKYLVIITNQVRDEGFAPLVRSYDFALLNTLDSSYTGSLAGAAKAVQGWTQLAGGYLAAATEGALNASNVALAYTFTTDAPTDVLKAMAAPSLFLGQATPFAANAGVINPPQPRDFDLIMAGINTPLALYPSTLGTVPADSFTRYVQGRLTIPVALPEPSATNGALDGIWRADSGVGALLSRLQNKPDDTYPPKDVDGTLNVTYRFPLAAQSGTENIPVLITVPGDYSTLMGPDCTDEESKPWPVVIFSHGITADRTSSIGLGEQLAMQGCYVTVAIDHPLHGVAPQSRNNDGGLINNGLMVFNTEQYANPAATPYGAAAHAAELDIAERHYNLGANPETGARQAMSYSGTVSGESGSNFINLTNFTRTRDNVRQSVMDLLNLSASLGSMDVTGDGEPDLDADRVYFVGHSLGAIIGTDFVSVINDPAVQAANPHLPTIKAAALASPGGQLTRLLENSPAFSPRIVGGLAASGINQGSVNYEKFMAVFQSVVDSGDAANFGQALAEDDTPILLFNMVGGGAIGADSPRLPSTLVTTMNTYFGGTYPPDHVVPNFDYFGDLGSLNVFNFSLPDAVDSATAPLAGTDPLVDILGLSEVNNENAGLIGNGETPLKVEMRFQKGTHATVAAADSVATFGSMVQAMVSFFNYNGTLLSASDAGAVLADPSSSPEPTAHSIATIAN